MRSARAWIRSGRRCVILIACSDLKLADGSAWFTPPVSGVMDQLQPADRNAVLSTRRSLAPKANAIPGPDVGGTSARGRYRPACERYAGRLYKRVEPSSLWPTEGDSRVIIVSALYGLVFPWEAIQKYDLMMKSSLGCRRPVYSRWREAHLGAQLARWATVHGVRYVIDLLTQPYRKALDEFVDLRPVGIGRVPFEYPGRYQASNHDRGDDLQTLLQLKHARGS